MAARSSGGAVFALVALGALWVLWPRLKARSGRPAIPGAVPGPTPYPNPVRAIMATVERFTVTDWRRPPAELAPLIRKAETDNGIPSGLLQRQLWQESRFRADAFNAASGARGIAQALPATAAKPGFGVPPLANPYDPVQAIPWAGKYMAAMKNFTGSWPLALAAYNWGPGYVRRRPRSAWPAETKIYVASITADVPVLA